MRINKITLVNFGSYEGENIFDTKVDGDRNIVLIGGKNGAGKTTLFTAMRLCLYGFLSMGYKNANSYYNRAIIKLINNNAKRNKPCSSSVSLDIELTNGRGIDLYTMSRKWTLDEILTEDLFVIKNGTLLEKDETADFEKFILSLIPPELFNLYFFDGEKIADFFLNEGGSTRIKDAFLTLCGYDTFDIMRKNFKRISASSKGKSHAGLKAYVAAKAHAQKDREKLEKIKKDLALCSTDIENCIADIASLEKEYTNSGGITQEEWDNKIFLLKDEERKRENWNVTLKKWANDVVPFIMVPSILRRVKEQIEEESADNKCKNFIDILESPELADLIGDKQEEIKKIVLEKYGFLDNRILDLSFEQSATLTASISELLDFDKSKVAKVKKLIKQSINKSAKIRKELEQSNIATVQEYMRRRANLFEKNSVLLNRRLELEQLLQQQKDAIAVSYAELAKTQAILEDEIKKESIGNISAKAIVMLDKLQTNLYHKQIGKVEAEFRRSINALMRKARFIDDIYIDDEFNIHVFRNEEISGKKIKDIISTSTKEQFIFNFGDRALKYLISQYGSVIFGEKNSNIKDSDTIILPEEIDKESFSNGEKQIFIMTLYYSLVQLGNHEIPFVIDTPYARIDTEHRQNIARHFFNKLKGQVFILSTNEEITGEHVQILQNKILSRYMLENTDNKKTVIIKDTYFEA